MDAGSPPGCGRGVRRRSCSPACGGGSIDEETKANEDKAAAAGGECGDLNIAVNPWVGYEANAYVVGHGRQGGARLHGQLQGAQGGRLLAGLRHRRGRRRHRGLGAPGLEKKFFAEEGDGSATDFGPTGNVGIIGWYVPGWLAEEHPDILDYKNLNKYADEFKTSESGGKGQFLGADPSYVQYDEAIVKNLDLDFKVVFSGGEAATARRRSRRRRRTRSG